MLVTHIKFGQNAAISIRKVFFFLVLYINGHFCVKIIKHLVRKKLVELCRKAGKQLSFFYNFFIILLNGYTLVYANFIYIKD